MSNEFKLVPVVPTEEMQNAARDWSARKYNKPVGFEASEGCYTAMLAAAPQPPALGSAQAEIEQLKAELAESEKGSREQTDQVKKAYEFLMLCRQDKTDAGIETGALRDAHEWLRVAAENLGAALSKSAVREQA